MAQSDNWEVVDLETKDMSSGMVVVMVEAEALEPTYEEARGWLDWLQWKDVIKVELEALWEAGTWEVVERLVNTNVVDSKWVFQIKKKADGMINTYKAQFVAHKYMV